MTPDRDAAPRLVLPIALAGRCLPADARAEIEGELMAHFETLAATRGRRAALRWAWRQPPIALAARLRWTRSPGSSSSISIRALFYGLADDGVNALKGVGRRPGLSIAIAAIVAIGAATTGAAVAIADAVLLRPLPYPQADKLVWINAFERKDGRGPEPGHVFVSYDNPNDVVDWAARARSLDALTAFETFDATIRAGDTPVRVGIAQVSPTVGRVLGIDAEYGRLFTAADAAPGTHVIVLSHALWQTQFSGDPNLVGRSVVLDDTPFTVVGILPSVPLAFPTAGTDAWLPLGPPRGEQLANRGGSWQRVVGRIRSDVTFASAEADLERVARDLAAQYPQTNSTRDIRLVPFRDALVGSTRDVLRLIAMAVAMVLAIACANVGHLLLVTVQARHREFAIRAALGARASRVARLLFVESALLSAAGGLAGLAAAPVLLRAFVALYPDPLPAIGAIAMSPLAVAAALGAVVLAAIAATIPSLLAFRLVDLAQAVRAGGRASDSRTHRRVRAGLVVAQVTLSTALLASSGLLLRSSWWLSHVPVGFDADGLVTFNVALSDRRYPTPADESRFYDELFARLRAVPGVTNVGATTLLPFASGEFKDGFVRVGLPDKYPHLPIGRLQVITPGYVEALALPLLAGRAFAATDVGGTSPVVLVNQRMERRYFPGGAVGRLIRFNGATRTIVGVVGDKRHTGARDEGEPEFYLPRDQTDNPRLFGWVAIRYGGPLEALTPAIRSAVRAVDPGVAIAGLETMSERMALSVAPERFRSAMVGGLAVAALVLAIVGLYGLVAYTVARESRDTAIRLALGAGAGRTANRVLRRTTAVVTAGVLAGLGLVVAGQAALADFLAGVTARDPLTLTTVAAVLIAVALAAAAGPARRAVRVDPARELRSV